MKLLQKTIPLALALGLIGPGPGALAGDVSSGPTPRAAAADKGKRLDRSGRKQVGKASFYARKFHGRTMADGTPMSLHDDNAASKTLPLGTVAQVKNLETGRSTVVTIQDRGPYVHGRIVDLSPASARQIGLTREDGVAPVEVTPLAVPQADGGVKSGMTTSPRSSRGPGRDG